MALDLINDIDIRTVNPDTLVDLNNVHININLPKNERMIDFARQMNNNPYYFKVGKIIVKVGFAKTSVTIDDLMEAFLRTQ